MAETLSRISERVGDMPWLLAQLDRLGVQPLLDEPFPTQGTWVGLSRGWATRRWLPPLLSEAKHRLNHVAPWAEPRLHTLRGSTGHRGQRLDLSDDGRVAVLEALRADARWPACEGALTPHLRRVYALPPERVCLERTTASADWSVTAAGLLPFGPSRAHRPDRPQVHVRRSGLAPLGLPVATDVVSGPRAAAPQYLAAITWVRARVGPRRVLYVGVCKMAALEPRACVQAGGDHDL
jgi:hypothetical protein